MATLFIPTRNRPQSLHNVLEYMRLFFPRTPIEIADGSDNCKIADVEKAINKYATNLPISFRHYDPELFLLDRKTKAIQNIDDEYIVVGADDDFPSMDVLDEGERFLRNNKGYVTAITPRINIRYVSDGTLRLKLTIVRPVEAEKPGTRMRHFSKWHFATTNAVTRKEHLLKKYHEIRQFLFKNSKDFNDYIGFLDFLIGNHDAAYGKIKAYSNIGYISGLHYKHTRLVSKTRDPLFFLKMPEQIMLIQNFLTFLATEHAGLSKDDAHKLSVKILKMRIAEVCGARLSKMGESQHSKIMNNPIVLQQYALLDESLELDQTKLPSSLRDKLNFAFKAMMNE